eukprot:TRINITY_DN335_c0_g1_i1.p1 TRINITY_DN335_c0_g1~~TRINITY_DN335_c0_g1_i1.p1  ORF type:complete len:345 (+),score=59.12 TRINITY_DN335_c0_g1_i1:179-1213(+)
MAVCEIPTAWAEQAAQRPSSNKCNWAPLIGTPICPAAVASAIRTSTRPLSRPPGDMHTPTGNPFEVRHTPRESLSDYAQRLLVGLRLEPYSWLSAIVLLSRCGVRIISRSAHLLLLTAVMVADKMQVDHCYSNSSYARVGRVPLKVLNRLERKFLGHLKFNACVSAADMGALMKELRTVDTREKLQEFYEIHAKRHIEYLQTQGQPNPSPQSAQDAHRQPPLQSPGLCVDTATGSDGLSSLRSPAPAASSQSARTEMAHTLLPSVSRVPVPPATARPSTGHRRATADVRLSAVPSPPECAAGAPGGRRGAARGRAERASCPPVPALELPRCSAAAPGALLHASL